MQTIETEIGAKPRMVRKLECIDPWFLTRHTGGDNERMRTMLDPFHFIMIAVSGWMNQRQLNVIDYLREENRVLREEIGERRLRFTDDQRRRLAAKAKGLGRPWKRASPFLDLRPVCAYSTAHLNSRAAPLDIAWVAACALPENNPT